MGIILEQKTKDMFGYYSNDLKPSSEKTVIWKCKDCDAEVEKKYRYAVKNDLCLSCSNKVNANTNKDVKIEKLIEWHKNNTHHFKGKHRTDEVKKKISQSNIGNYHSDKTKKKISVKMSGDKNPMYGRSVFSVWLEKYGEIEANIRYQKMLINKSKNVKRGKESNFYGKCYHGKGEWYKCKNGDSVWMRSSWEIKYATYLDKNNIEWFFEPEAFPINYNNAEGTYRPDFYLIDCDLYVEVKGWWRDDAKDKYLAFKKQYRDKKIEVYDKDKLKKLKII